MSTGDLPDLLAGLLPAPAATWLAAARARITTNPAAVHELFPAVGRWCGRDTLVTGYQTILGWTVDDAVRALLLDMLPLPAPALLATARELYSSGDAAERRGVLRALTLLDRHPGVGAGAVPIVADALRTHDTRLIGAALGPYAARYLDVAAYRQAVLKCVFCGIPLVGVAGLSQRADAELARSLTDYAREREAAGREVPADVRSLIEVIQGRKRAGAIHTP